jgi:hypothetical protein
LLSEIWCQTWDDDDTELVITLLFIIQQQAKIKQTDLIHNFSALIKNLSRYRHAGDKGKRSTAPTHS